jgi:hypothetical protein
MLNDASVIFRGLRQARRAASYRTALDAGDGSGPHRHWRTLVQHHLVERRQRLDQRIEQLGGLGGGQHFAGLEFGDLGFVGIWLPSPCCRIRPAGRCYFVIVSLLVGPLYLAPMTSVHETATCDNQCEIVSFGGRSARGTSLIFVQSSVASDFVQGQNT